MKNIEREFVTHDFEKKAGQLKQDLPIIYLVWKDRDTPVLAKALAL